MLHLDTVEMHKIPNDYYIEKHHLRQVCDSIIYTAANNQSIIALSEI